MKLRRRLCPLFQLTGMNAGARILTDGTNLVANYQFYFSSKKFLADNAKATVVVLDALNETGFTIVVITHDLAVAAHAGRMIAISDGVLSERVQVDRA